MCRLRDKPTFRRDVGSACSAGLHKLRVASCRDTRIRDSGLVAMATMNE